MRKLAAVLCVIALMLTMAVPAFANPSIDDISETVIEVVTEEPLEEGLWIEVQEANPENYTNEDVKEVVKIVNNVETVATVQETVEKLAEYLPEDTTLSDDGILTVKSQDGAADTVIDLKEYDFVTNFADLVLTDGSEVSFDDSGKVVSAKVKMTVDALKGAEDLSDYLIMLIDPETGEVYFIELDPETFDPETGEITVDFPCLGTFSLIQK